MGIGITEEHRALADSVRGFAARNIAPRGMEHEPFRAAMAAQGLFGLHLPEEHGGQGGGLTELAVALEALGERCAPGSFLPTVLASAIIARAGSAHDLLPGLARGELTAAVVLPGAPAPPVPPRRTGTPEPGNPPGKSPGAARRGPLPGPVHDRAGLPGADLFVLPLPDGRWAALDRADCAAAPLEGIDLTRPLAAVSARAVPDGRVLDGITADLVNGLAAVLLGAEACGAAAWAVATAADYAKVREQFGRPIGQFQGVKHRCAAMLVALEQARAAVWDAARALDARDASAGSPPAATSPGGDPPAPRPRGAAGG
nr:hypothetical protein GCM10020093_040580 [Planobispora longispora]